MSKSNSRLGEGVAGISKQQPTKSDVPDLDDDLPFDLPFDAAPGTDEEFGIWTAARHIRKLSKSGGSKSNEQTGSQTIEKMDDKVEGALLRLVNIVLVLALWKHMGSLHGVNYQCRGSKLTITFLAAVKRYLGWL